MRYRMARLGHQVGRLRSAAPLARPALSIHVERRGPPSPQAAAIDDRRQAFRGAPLLHWRASRLEPHAIVLDFALTALQQGIRSSRPRGGQGEAWAAPV
jgi:hypothetical protein